MIYFVSHRRMRFLGCCQAKDCITRCINCIVLGANIVLTLQVFVKSGEFFGGKKDVDCVSTGDCQDKSCWCCW